MAEPTNAILDDLLAQRSWIEALCRTLVRNPQDAQDVAQATWLSALARRLPLQNPRGWLRRVAENHARQQRRAAARTADREARAAAERADSAPSVAEVHAAFAAQRSVATAVHELAEPYRTVVLLHHFEGLSLAAIARRQNEPEGTVRWRLFRAHELLRTRLQDEFGPDWQKALLPLCGAVAGRTGLALATALVLLVATSAWLWFDVAHGNLDPTGGAVATAPVPAERPAAPDADPGQRLAAAQPGEPAAPAAAATPPAEQKAIVRARVCDEAGAPLAGATLRFHSLLSGHIQLQSPLQVLLLPSATTDADGRTALVLQTDGRLMADLPKSMQPGIGECWHLQFEASAKGCLDQRRAAFVQHGDDTDLGTFRLAPAATLRGRVVDTEGNPIAGAMVGAFGIPLPTDLAKPGTQEGDLDRAACRAETGSLFGRGRYTLPAAPRGPVLVVAAAKGYRAAWAYANVATADHALDDLVLQAEVTKANERPRAAPPQAVLVLDPSGAPVGDAIVYGQREDGGSMSRTDAAGRMSLGTVRLEDRSTSYDTVVAIDSRGLWTPAIRRGVRPDEDTVTLRLAPAQQLVDVAVVSPQGRSAGAAGSLPPGGGDVGVQWVADDGLRAELYLRADEQGHVRFAPPPFAAHLVVFRTGCARYESAPFAPGTWPAVVHVALVPTAGIHGRVVVADAAGAASRPVADAEILVLTEGKTVLRNGYRTGAWNGRGNWDTRSGADGTFRIDRDAAATFRLRVRAPGRAPFVTEPQRFEPGVDVDVGTIVLGSGGTIHGRLVHVDGSPVARAIVAINHELAGPQTTITGRDGSFTFADLMPGAYEVRPGKQILDMGWTESPLDPAAARQPWAKDAVVADGATTEVVVRVDAFRLELRLVDRSGGLDFRGWTAHMRYPYADAEDTADTLVDADGRVELVSWCGGRRAVEVRAPGGPFGDVRVRFEVDLAEGTLERTVPLALAPYAANVALPGVDGDHWLRQQQDDVSIDCKATFAAATGRATAALAPLGTCAVLDGERTVGTVTVAR